MSDAVIPCLPGDPDSLASLFCGDGLRVAWDLDQFVASIVRNLPLSVCKSLATSGHAFLRPFSIAYIRGKVFVIAKGRERVSVYGISQYWPDEEPDPPDAAALSRKAEALLRSLGQLGVYPRRLTSPVAIYDDFLFRHLDLPTAADVPEPAWECLDYAIRCTSRQWVSAYQVGHWSSGECWDYDLNSAYPREASLLRDLRGAAFIKSDAYIPDATYGFLRGRVSIVAPVSPIVVEMDDRQINPVGEVDTYLTLDEARFIEKWGLGTFKLHSGWFVRCDNRRPLMSTMRSLYSIRGRDPIVDNIVKRAANGLIGKFLETHRNGAELGSYYNPIWHAIVTSRARLRVAEFLYNNDATDSLIHIGVDGCLLDHPVPLPYNGTPAGMGSWRLSGTGPAFVLSPGLILAGDRHPKGIHYGLLQKEIAAHPRSSVYSVKLRRRVTLVEAAAAGDVAGVGEERDFHSTVDLYTLPLDQDRLFYGLPRTGTQLLSQRYRSAPIRV